MTAPMPDQDKAAGVIWDALGYLGITEVDADRVAEQLHDSGLLLPEGWVAVPREAKPEMLAAWCRMKNTGSTVPGETGDDRSDAAAYRAMIQAAQGEKG